MSLYKKCTAKPYFFLVIETILASNNSLRSRKNLSEKKYKKLIIVDKI